MRRRSADRPVRALLKAENLFLTLGILVLGGALAMAAWSRSETTATRGWRSVVGRVLGSRAEFRRSQARYGQGLTWVR